MTAPDINSWKLESIRLSLFLADQLSDKGEGSWKKLIGQDPEIITTRPQTETYVEDGVFENYRLSFNHNKMSPPRIDWIAYQPMMSDSLSELLIGYDRIQDFTHLFEHWLKNERLPLFRIGLGAILVQPTSNHRTAYETLSHYLPNIKFDLDKWSDFTFQVNNKSDSKEKKGLKINQISRWNAIVGQKIAFSSESEPIINESYFCRLELDVNTAADNKEQFSSEEVLSIFQELQTIAHEYACNGLIY